MSNITAKPIKPQNLKLDSISMGSIKTMPSGAKIVYLNYNGGMLFVQSPELNVSMDTGTYYPENDKSGKYAIRTSMDGYNSDGPMKTFHDAILSMDKFLIEKGIECAGEWFENLKWYKKKGSTEEKVSEYYTHMVKVSLDSDTGEPNGKWPPSFAFKIVKRDGKILCDCYDSDKNELVTEGDDAVNLEQMFKKGSKLKTILKCNGLWISNVGWGCTWRAEQIKIDTPMGFSGYAFEDTDDEDEGHTLTRQSTLATPVKNDSSKPDNLVDSDSDSDDDSEEEEVVKKKVKK
tara:strand:+ start:9556 stop:10425 length:870 start_codon:yes stop_codon:yes gene_type:complete